MARFAPDPPTIAAPGQTGAALAPLPIAALRLDADCMERLRLLGFEMIADLMAVPRAPLALRFGPEPGCRLDQAPAVSLNRLRRSAHPSWSMSGRPSPNQSPRWSRYVGAD